MTTTTKIENIHFRVSPEVKKLIDKAILLSGHSLTEFATRSLLDAANEVIEREHTTVLSNRDRDLLLQLLDADAKPDKGLRDAAKIHRKLIIE